MICRLCIEQTSDSIQIFSEETKNLNIARILNKHFWFQITENDCISTAICKNCWPKVSDFHEFYEYIEASQKKLENLVKKEKEHEKQHAYEDILIDEHSNEIFINTEVECKLQLDPEDIDDFYDSEDNDPLITFKQHSQVKQEIKQEIPAEIVDIDCSIETFTTSATQHTKRRRGRPRKNESIGAEPLKAKNKKIEYQLKNQEIDEKIAQFMKLMCDKCGQEQENFAALRLHMKKVHNVKGYAVCCSRKFLKRRLLTEHIDRHLNPERFKCELCGRTFAAKHCLSYHMLLKHQPDEEKAYECKECHKKFPKEILLERHNIIHQEPKYFCDMCQKGFPTEKKLTFHVKYVHDKHGTMCDICAKVIIGSGAFKRHQLEHQGVQLPRQQCDICLVWFKNEYILKNHKLLHADEGKLHKCKECGKVAPTRRALLCHQRFVHTQQPEHECSVCGKAFKKSLALREHMTLHTGEVLYNCPHCPKTFNSNSNMYSHRKKAHRKEFEESRKDRMINGITKNNKIKSLLPSLKLIE